MEEKDDFKSIIIECECHTHLLKIQSNGEFYNNKKIVEDFDFAMFSYGNYIKKPGIIERIKGAFKYVWTGEMYSDQICLGKEEAKKLVDFINGELNG